VELASPSRNSLTLALRNGYDTRYRQSEIVARPWTGNSGGALGLVIRRDTRANVCDRLGPATCRSRWLRRWQAQPWAALRHQCAACRPRWQARPSPARPHPSSASVLSAVSASLDRQVWSLRSPGWRQTCQPPAKPPKTGRLSYRNSHCLLRQVRTSAAIAVARPGALRSPSVPRSEMQARRHRTRAI